MKYYKQNNEVFAYELDGSQDHLIGNKEPMIDEEVEAHIKPPKTDAQILAEKIAEARKLLDSTQFKFGDDYDQKDTPEWLALKVKRQEAREFIRVNDVPNT